MLRRFLATLALVLAFTAPQASAQSLTTYTFATLPGSPTAGQLAWITDNAGTAMVGSPASGGAVAGNLDLVAWDGVDSRWEFVSRVPSSGSGMPLEKYLAAIRIGYDDTASGASVSDVQAALESLFASQKATTSGLFAWPTFEGLGGVGRPTQAIYIDTLALHLGTNGQGQDDNASVFSAGGCAGVDSRFDVPCFQGSEATKAQRLTARGIWGTDLRLDWTDTVSTPQWCRQTSAPYAHATGAGTAYQAENGHPIQLVVRSNSLDTYRAVKADGASVNCVAQTGDLLMRIDSGFAVSSSDTVMQFLEDGTHPTSYASRWLAQTVLDFAWEDIYPEPLGLANLITDGYSEAGCGAAAPWTASAGTLTARTNRNQNSSDPGQYNAAVGSACSWGVPGAGATLTSNAVTVNPGEYYVGSIIINTNGTGESTDLTVSVIDQANAAWPGASIVWWWEGTGIGRLQPMTEIASFPIYERACYGGCRFRFALKVPAGTSTARIRVTNAPGTAQWLVDETWMRKKLHPDLRRHPVIADGRASMQIFTDSRGNPAAERLPAGLDYMLGYPAFGVSRSLGSYRPNLYLDKAPSQSVNWVSGGRLGDYVGPVDSLKKFDGSSVSTTIGSQISPGKRYCLAFYGVNDWYGGQRPTSGTLNADAANKHRYWIDQLRGFEQYAEQAGCVPLILGDTAHGADVTSNDLCKSAAGTTMNCADWYNEMHKNLLHGSMSTLSP